MLDTLFRKLQEATDPVTAQTLEQAIWEQWTLLPEPTQRTLMFKGMGEMQNRDFAGAVAAFEMAKKANPHIGGIDAEIARLRALGGDPPEDPLGCGRQTAGR